MGRAEMRRAMRAQGWRSNKAKGRARHRGRITIVEPPKQSGAEQNMAAVVAEAEAEVAEHERRNAARKMGLLVPPSAAEARTLRAQGTNVAAGGIVVPGR